MVFGLSIYLCYKRGPDASSWPPLRKSPGYRRGGRQNHRGIACRSWARPYLHNRQPMGKIRKSCQKHQCLVARQMPGRSSCPAPHQARRASCTGQSLSRTTAKLREERLLLVRATAHANMQKGGHEPKKPNRKQTYGHCVGSTSLPNRPCLQGTRASCKATGRTRRWMMRWRATGPGMKAAWVVGISGHG